MKTYMKHQAMRGTYKNKKMKCILVLLRRGTSQISNESVQSPYEQTVLIPDFILNNITEQEGET